MCKKRSSRNLLPLDMLHPSYMEIARPGVALLAVCMVCFKIVRSKEGRIMGYRYVRGKVQQYVVEELFGPDTYESVVQTGSAPMPQPDM